jgi:ADP-heptose:LPS heptosyltransferase
VFISLDYKGDVQNPRIKQYKWATQASDYDLTAALIASLDAVIGINTTAIHCANGLGVKTHVLLPEKYQWRYEADYLWCKTATLYHKKASETWRDIIRRIEL